MGNCEEEQRTNQALYKEWPASAFKGVTNSQILSGSGMRLSSARVIKPELAPAQLRFDYLLDPELSPI
jgi:hypothetical protein